MRGVADASFRCDVGTPPSPEFMSTASERELRAKYLDWCSARLADRFLALSPDEIYELAERASQVREPALEPTAASGSGLESPEPARDSDARPESPINWLEPDNFRVLVTRVAEVLADTLPSFEEWSAEYQKAPARFDRELLGFWKENLRDSDQ